MKAAEITQMSTAEIRQRISEEQENLTTLRFQHASSQLANTSQLGKLKKDIARLNTVLRQRELSGEDK